MIGDDFAGVLAAAQRGDEGAFEVLWRDANPPLLRYLRVLSGNAAEDLAAETWHGVVRGLARFRGDEAGWRGWLFTLARRRAVDEIRRASRQPATTPAAEIMDTEPSADSADEALTKLGTRAALDLISRLPQGQAEVILLRVIGGLDTDRVAELLGSSPNAVRVAAHRGLKRLAKILADAGVTQ